MPLVVDGQNTVVLDFPGSGSRPARFFPGIRRSRIIIHESMMQVFCHFKRVQSVHYAQLPGPGQKTAL
ncbi:hypothetical protein E4U45_005549 [Claviceps purpurea]|nr:hypothetical protein E4U45_005549 [Claviceps purpurea]